LWMDFAGDEARTLQQEDAWVHESVAYARQLIALLPHLILTESG